MGPGDLAGDNCKRGIALVVPFEAVGMDQHGVGDAAPFAHKPRAGLNRNRRSRLSRIALRRPLAIQLAHYRLGEAAKRPLLEFVCDAARQQIAGQSHRRRRSIKPSPLATQFEDRQFGEPHELRRDIDRRSVHVSYRDAP